MAGKKSSSPSATQPDSLSGNALANRDGILSGYGQFLEDLKVRIRSAQVRAALSVNRELIALYWHTGKSIVERQRVEGWGKSVVDRLSADIRREFPGLKGFSASNIWRMRSFYLTWTSDAQELAQGVRDPSSPNLAQIVRDLAERNLPHPISEIPWGHNVLLLEKIKDPLQRIWYASQTTLNGWSRPVLAHQIETDLIGRQGKALTNFDFTLPSPQSDLAQQTLKDPYLFDFLNLEPSAQERELEKSLLFHIQQFLVELGVGFAFVGRQVHLEVEGDDYFLDLLFYHLDLRCFIVIDLKMEEFKPEFAGKMNFYLSAVDAKMRREGDQASIGLLLCRERKRLTVEYALRDMKKPIGVAEWKTKLVRSLPKQYKGSLPTIEDLERELMAAEEESLTNDKIKG